jgi:hypothetical protein
MRCLMRKTEQHQEIVRTIQSLPRRLCRGVITVHVWIVCSRLCETGETDESCQPPGFSAKNGKSSSDCQVLVAAHNLDVAGSNPVPATQKALMHKGLRQRLFSFRVSPIRRLCSRMRRSWNIHHRVSIAFPVRTDDVRGGKQ